jgi:UDP-N-acetylmuramyl pentapeptide phosphotransferase/UDP-N-acetylglucosamine-1-phosphate transferase
VRDFQAISILGSGAITLGVAWALVARWIPAPLAYPNDRSLHVVPVPRTGGLAIWAGSLFAVVFATVPWTWLVPLGCVLVVSLIDDWRGVPAPLRLAVHAVAALGATAPYHDASNASGLTLIVLDALVIVWMANLYNFMDGADGLAGGMGLSGFGAYAVAAMLRGDPNLAITCAVLASACAAFLVFNRPPARLFMGDVGAVGLGFVAALIGLHGYATGVWRWWFPPLVFAPFIVDATVTLVRRWQRGQRLSHAHRDHFYQRAILMDGAHGGTLRVYFLWMVACAAIGIAMLVWYADAGAVVLVATAAAFGWYCRSIDRRWARNTHLHHAG